MHQPDQRRMGEIIHGMGPNTSEKIRRLVEAGYRQADVARFLNIRDQFVSNVVRKAKSQPSPVQEEPRAEQIPAGGDLGPLRTRLDAFGRLVIPAAFRAAMQVDEGDELVARVVDGELRLATPEMAVKRAQKLVRELIPGDESLADSLIADRRREAAMEAAND